MDCCTPHFGKSLNDLTIDDLTSFFATEKVESDQLEFKSFGGLTNDHYKGITRTISGFLNSKGGLLIWGAPVGVNVAGRNEKMFRGNLTPINQVLSKDQVISKCSDNITPLPMGIRVKAIEDGNQGCICVFEVDESNYSPHQFDKTYYMRIDGQTKPAPHHYIEALFKKIRFPEIDGYLKFTKVADNGNHFYLHFEIYLINFSPLQNAEDISFRVVFDKAKFPRAAIDTHYAMSGHEWRRDSYKSVLHYGQPIRDKNHIEINKNEVGPTDILYGMLTFGARNSPSKSSEYKIDLGQLKLGANPDKAVIERQENQLFKDIQDKKGGTKEYFLKTLLGR